MKSIKFRLVKIIEKIPFIQLFIYNNLNMFKFLLHLAKFIPTLIIIASLSFGIIFSNIKGLIFAFLCLICNMINCIFCLHYSVGHWMCCISFYRQLDNRIGCLKHFLISKEKVSIAFLMSPQGINNNKYLYHTTMKNLSFLLL